MEEWEKGNEATNKNQEELTWELCSSHLELVLPPLNQKQTPILFCLLLLLLLLSSSLEQLQSCKKEARIVQKDINNEERQYMQQYNVPKNHC